jgi:endonuclease-3
MYQDIISSLSKSLQSEYGKHHLENGIAPIDYLVLGILSQNTNTKNAQKAFSLLKQKYPDYRCVIKANIKDIEDAIRVGGLYHRKARLIKHVLKRIWDQQHSFDISFLRKMDINTAIQYLDSYKGVGLKTAYYCMLLGLNMPVMPVDSSILRITKRLGLVDYDTGPEETSLFYQEFLEKDEVLDMYINLLTLGKKVCKASKTRCSECALNKKCRYYVVSQAACKRSA